MRLTSASQNFMRHVASSLGCGDNILFSSCPSGAIWSDGNELIEHL